MLKRAPLARLGASNGSDPLVGFSARLLDGKSFRNIKRLSMKDVSSGEYKTVLCCGENTVAAVGNDYEWRAGHKGARARLFYDGSRLGEGKTVAESGIGSGAEIDVSRGQEGGGSSSDSNDSDSGEPAAVAARAVRCAPFLPAPPLGRRRAPPPPTTTRRLDAAPSPVLPVRPSKPRPPVGRRLVVAIRSGRLSQKEAKRQNLEHGTEKSHAFKNLRAA